jgi:superfamily II DNA or RNA helicase
MSKHTTIVIKDEVNCAFLGLDATTRRKLVTEVEYFLPYAKHTPAFKLGRWNGKVSFCDISGRTYINLLDRLLPIVVDSGYAIEIDDRREQHSFTFDEIDTDSYSHIKWPEGHPMAGEPILLREHQVEVLNGYFANPQCLHIAPTGAGKTIICAVMSHNVEKYGKSVVIVPSKDLVTQTEEDYINMGLSVGVFFGDRKDLTRTHTVCTWQSLEALYKKDKEALADFLEECVCVIVDECHKSKSDVLKKLLSGPFAHVPIRWGLTGTLPPEEQDKTALLACIGQTEGVVKATDLQEKGILANLHITITQLKDVGPLFRDYASELKWLTTSPPRIEAIADQIQGWSESGNTLVLVDRIQTGEMLAELVPDSVFVSGAMKSKDRKEEYNSVKTVDGKIIIATYGVASTGINLPRIFNLVLIEPGKSFVRVIQSIGRGLRVTEDKDFVNVYDVCSDAKYSKRHLTERKKFYSTAGYPFSIKKIDY